MPAKKKPSKRIKMVGDDQFLRQNPEGQEGTTLVFPLDAPQHYESSCGWADDVDMAVYGREILVFSKNPEMAYVSMEVFDAKTGEKIGEAFTDKPAEIDHLLPKVFDEKAPMKCSACMKKMRPYATGDKTYKAPKKKAKKKANKKTAKKR